MFHNYILPILTFFLLLPQFFLIETVNVLLVDELQTAITRAAVKWQGFVHHDVPAYSLLPAVSAAGLQPEGRVDKII